MNEITLVNFAIVLSLVPLCQGLVQMLKHEKMGTYGVRVLTLVIGEALTFLVRQGAIPGFSESLQNPYLAGLTGLVVALIASGFYNMTRNDIVNKIAKSTTDVTVPSELVDVDKNDEASTSKEEDKD